MSLVLHLSDLHLTQARASEPIDDHKKGSFVIAGDRRTLGALIEGTFDRIAQDLKESNLKLSAIVVSGDITNQGDQSGMELFQPLLAKLMPYIANGDKRRVVVVPGNHDVRRFEHNDRDVYYKGFLEASKGCTRPFLEDVTGEDESPDGRYLLLPDERLLILPIDSCRYCSAERELPPKLSKALVDLQTNWATKLFARDELLQLKNELREFSTEDAARISPRQFAVLEGFVSAAENEYRALGGNHDDLVRVAVLHHQILPVTLSEEEKPFESITNLMQARAFLRRRGFKVVLHGHKHVQTQYWDLIPDLSDPSARGWRTLVVAAPMLGEAHAGHDAVQMLEFDTDSLAPVVSVKSAALDQGDRATFWPQDPKTFFLYKQHGHPGSTGSQPNYVTGADVREVHARAIRFLRLAPSKETQGLLCHLDDRSLRGTLSELYEAQCRELGASGSLYPADHRERFEQIVEWWQNEDYSPQSAGGFNHGSRLKIGSTNQLDTAIEHLELKRPSSKAIVTFLRPEEDLVSLDTEFPSFCTLQLLVRESGGTSYVDAIAYFRKQEMAVWWLFNVAEILGIQQRFARMLGGCEIGAITTISGRATLTSVMPQVAVPALERATTLTGVEYQVRQMCRALAEGTDSGSRQQALSRWEGMLSELLPPERFDKAGVLPVVSGLDLLIERLDEVPPADRPRRFDDLRRDLGQLREENARHAQVLREDKSTSKDASFYEHRTLAKQLVDSILLTIRQVLS